jgi:hypothetical protein
METFKSAKTRLLKELQKNGWTVKEDLTYPWAKARVAGEDVQIWFKTQSIYMGGGLSPTMKMARSICSDYRGLTAAKLEQLVVYYNRLP